MHFLFGFRTESDGAAVFSTYTAAQRPTTFETTHSAGCFARVNAEREKQRLAGDVLVAVQLSPSRH
jgi:hypothetical protein